jgi:hypothetical protein
MIRTMQYYALQNHWGSLVRNFKDEEKQYDRAPYDTDQLALAILDYIRYTSIRQYKLFQQKRGEEFERMIETLKKREHDADAMKRYLEEDDLWAITLELAEQ